MSYAQAIFQKDLYQITKQDLEAFFSEPQEESSILEFKEGGTDLKKIHPEIAAFLNTEGGLLILGAPREVEHPTKKGYKQAVGDLTPCTVRDRDVIMRNIGTSIAPVPTTIRIHSIEIEGGSVYILEIGQSMHPPHQVSDSGRYYIRLEREAKAAPHGLVEAMFFKRQRPNLEIKIKSENIDPGKAPGDARMKITFSLTNSSSVTAESWGYILDFFDLSDCKNNDPNNQITTQPNFTKTINFHPQDIIVKGLSTSFEITVQPTASSFIFKSCFYGKDVEAITNFYCLKLDGSIERYLSPGEEDSDQAFNTFLAKYDADVVNEIAEKLTPFIPPQLVPATTNMPMTDHYKARGIQLPSSYLRFFKCSDGFNGHIGNHRCNFWGISKLIRPSEYESFITNSSNFQIKIGEVDMRPIFIYCKNDQLDYRILTADGMGNVTHVARISRSFVGLLFKMKNAPNLTMLLRNTINE